MKICTKCQIPQNVEEFYPKKGGLNGLSSWCKGCISEVGKKNHVYNREFSIKNHLHTKYKLTKEEVTAMYDNQKGCCKICGVPKPLFSKHTGLVIDHCHASGKVRGLLCSKCNTLLGAAQDNPATLLQAICYLKGEEKQNLCDTPLDVPLETEAQLKSA